MRDKEGTFSYPLKQHHCVDRRISTRKIAPYVSEQL